MNNYFRSRVVYPLHWINVPEFSVVIPVKDDPDIVYTLDSINASALNAKQEVGVVIVINHALTDTEEIKQSNRALLSLLELKIADTTWSNLLITPLFIETATKKTTGVGYARRIGMDAVAYWYAEHGQEGVICSLDADTFVSLNYFQVLHARFVSSNAVGTAFTVKHRLEGLSSPHLLAMESYELYLLYTKLCERYVGHPYSFITIGSGFAVKSDTYIARGGMNNRQAGEDFYFIQKLIDTGRFTELLEIEVYPSARLSFRTPFGTGRALDNIIHNDTPFLVQDFVAYQQLKCMLDVLPSLYADDGYRRYLDQPRSTIEDYWANHIGLCEILDDCHANTSSFSAFRKRFYNHFNGFQLLRTLNELHKKHLTQVPLLTAVNNFLATIHEPQCATITEALTRFHELEKDQRFGIIYF